MYLVLNLIKQTDSHHGPTVVLSDQELGLVGLMPVFDTYEQAHKWCRGDDTIIELIKQDGTNE